jgi:hypothetical protein
MFAAATEREHLRCPSPQEVIVNAPAVRSSLGLTLVAEIPLPMTAHLEYRADDPYAVAAAFHTGDDEPVRWVFARDLLDEGLVHPAGDGDVRVIPGRNDWGEHTLALQLASPDGVAVLEASAEDVLAFLEQSYRLVPPGTESDHCDVDAALSMLLGS